MGIVNPVGKLNLEGLMSRAEILFTAGYKFKGELDVEQLKTSYYAIIPEISKFNHELNFRAQNDFNWQARGNYNDRFHVIDCDDIEQALKTLSANVFELRKNSGNHPMNMAVLQSAKSNEFYIAFICAHEYVDARSGESVFHLIVDHYNANKRADQAAANAAVATAKNLKTIDASEMVKKLANDDYNLEANTESIINYATQDAGDYGVRIGTLDDLLPSFRDRVREPVSCVVDAAKIIEQVRSQYPHVTKNAIITAVIHQAMYNINVETKGKDKAHLISGKMVSDLMPPEMRNDYFGNYIAFVPVTTQSEISLADKAKSIHERIVEFRSKQINLSCFELVEQAADANVVGTADDEVAYVVTNWNNYRFLKGGSFLSGCESLAHRSAVNVDPADAGGAALINRAIVVINLSFNDELCVSMFPSLRSDDENQLLINEISQIINNA